MLTDLTSKFPGLLVSGYRRTSPPTANYNCIAWAAGDSSRWWWPSGPFAYWPPGAPKTVTIAAFLAAYGASGYQECDAGDLEAGFEKIVIYTKSGAPTHAARQLPDGQWSSKLGSLDDIAHHLDGVTDGPEGYGQPAVFMKRALIRVSLDD